MSKHTPGPWKIVRSSDYTEDSEDTTVQSIEGADGRTVYFTDSGYFKPKEADVALIAAAPDLAAVLEKILLFGCDAEIRTEARAVLAKARP